MGALLYREREVEKGRSELRIIGGQALLCEGRAVLPADALFVLHRLPGGQRGGFRLGGAAGAVCQPLIQAGRSGKQILRILSVGRVQRAERLVNRQIQRGGYLVHQGLVPALLQKGEDNVQ